MNKRFLALLPMLALWCGCESQVAGGPCSETTNGYMCSESPSGFVATVLGNPAPYASVAIRKVDHMADSAQMEASIVVADGFADAKGVVNMEVPSDGEYRLTVLHNGAAYTKVVTSESYAELDTVKLTTTAVMKGEVDIPKGSEHVWVGVLGTDILVPSDANGVFVIPSVPAGDSLQLYFVSEDYSDVLNKEAVYFTPAETAFKNYKEAPVDTSKTEPEEPADSTQKIVVIQEDGSVASMAQVALRAVDYKAEKLALQNSIILGDVVTDGNGMFSMEWPEDGEYRLTVTAEENVFSKVFDAKDLTDLDTIQLKPSATISSKVTLNSEESFAWVGIYGLDLMVKTDATGAYVLPSLPAGDSLQLYFVHADDSIPFVEWSVKASKEGTNYLAPVKHLYDFEEDNENWYMQVDTLYKNSTFKFSNGWNDSTHLLKNHLEEDSTRNSMVFRTKYNLADDPYAWVLLGTKLDGLKNFAAIDSIEFYAKGDGEIRVAVENWIDYSTNAKASSSWMKVDSKWTRMVVKPSEMCMNDSGMKSCAETWGKVKTQVKQVHFFFASGKEIYIDDVKIYGALF